MSYKDEIKTNVETFDVVEQKQFDENAKAISAKWTEKIQRMGSNMKIDVSSILEKCKNASKNGKINIIVSEEDEKSLVQLIPIEEIALITFIRKSSPKNNNVLVLLDNQKVRMKIKNPYGVNGMPETIEMEFEEMRNNEKQETKNR